MKHITVKLINYVLPIVGLELEPWRYYSHPKTGERVVDVRVINTNKDKDFRKDIAKAISFFLKPFGKKIILCEFCHTRFLEKLNSKETFCSENCFEADYHLDAFENDQHNEELEERFKEWEEQLSTCSCGAKYDNTLEHWNICGDQCTHCWTVEEITPDCVLCGEDSDPNLPNCICWYCYNGIARPTNNKDWDIFADEPVLN